ncbi:hypothetical protein [Mucilaginibacter sp. KACC 22063]|uniref:hypothetical protein n=1 Tax=Mucilaginibacter sp. KACC 22063 TaxID=3025666 RepID=UPI00236540AB|nr:hypothetical protein [Mucilaginibacter sp. KACC 22063]WDF57308.1 hypothetical protein PQ461_09605 [Mucilaginibacter sp. KACC 22063]
MILKRGIVIKSDLPDFADQLTINTGTNPAVDDINLFYTPGSFIPKRDWQPLNDKTKTALFDQPDKQKLSNTIRIGKVPDVIENTFRKMKLHECINPDDVYPTVRKHEEIVKHLADDLDNFFKQFSTNRQYKFHRITRAMPNRDTITCFYKNEKFTYIGLHVDRSRLYKLHTAYQSGNRISINLGKESRYLATVNLSLIQAYNMIKKKVSCETLITPYNIASLFFQHHPDYPVVKIEIKPYQYYIAPTDNFFHDATTVGMSSVDITLVYTGNFDKI